MSVMVLAATMTSVSESSAKHRRGMAGVENYELSFEHVPDLSARYTSDAPEDVSTALHGSGEGSLCTKVHAAPASPLYNREPCPERAGMQASTTR